MVREVQSRRGTEKFALGIILCLAITFLVIEPRGFSVRLFNSRALLFTRVIRLHALVFFFFFFTPRRGFLYRIAPGKIILGELSRLIEFARVTETVAPLQLELPRNQSFGSMYKENQSGKWVGRIAMYIC